jgi:hypothetical protein
VTIPTPGIILCLLLYLFVAVLFVAVLFVALLFVILHPPIVAAQNSGQTDRTSPAQTADNPRKLLNFDDGAVALQLVQLHQTPGYIRFLCMRLTVVHEKYWLAILNKDKLVEFRSSRSPILLEAGDSLLFALAMRHRKRGMDALILARVLRVELLQIDEAREAHFAERLQPGRPSRELGCDLRAVHCARQR